MIINLTGADLVLYAPNTPDVVDDPAYGRLRSILPESRPARLEHEDVAEDTIDGIPCVDVVYGEAGVVPPPEGDGTVYVVPLAIGLAVAGLQDNVLVPHREVHTPTPDGRPGPIIGYRALARPVIPQPDPTIMSGAWHEGTT